MIGLLLTKVLLLHQSLAESNATLALVPSSSLLEYFWGSSDDFPFALAWSKKDYAAGESDAKHL